MLRDTEFEIMMPRFKIVPSRFQQPLSIDTDMSYDLDMSKFPGLDDPHQMYEPTLLIASGQERVNFGYYRNINGGDNSSHCRNSPAKNNGSSNMMEDLLHVIDSCSSELLDRLVDTSIQNQVPKSAGILYKSVMDACDYNSVLPTNACNSKSAVPQIIQAVPRATRTVPRNTNTVSKSTHVYQATNDISIMNDYYSDVHYETDFEIHKHSWITSSVNILQDMLPERDNSAERGSCKRERSVDLCDSSYFKHHCNSVSATSGNNCGEGYTNHYQTFQETRYGRGVMV